MIDAQKVFDSYDIKARLFPSIFTLAPLMLSAYLWYPNLLTLEQVGLNLIVIASILFLLSKLSRELGYRKQKQLLTKWGDFPTTLMLRLQDSTIDNTTKSRYHKYLKQKVSNIVFPNSLEEELADIEFYDGQYRSAVKWLKENTRNNAIVQVDNSNYGFARNTLGLKKLGVLICVFSLGLNLIGIYNEYKFDFAMIPFHLWVAIMIVLVFLFIWFLFVTDKWVKNTADSYAVSLLASSEIQSS